MQIPYHTSRGTVDLAALQPTTDFAGPMIAEALSKINRFSGHTRLPWSVAAHSVLVAAICPTHALKGWALLHDAHEAFIGDITSPALELICDSGTRKAVEHAIYNAKGRLDRAIGAAWGCVPQSLNHEIRHADWLALQAERHFFFEEPFALTSEKDRSDAAMAAELIRSLPKGSDWKWAKEEWLKRAYQLEIDGLLKLPVETYPTSTSLAG